MELLVVISIIVLMLSIAVPAMTAFVRGRALEQAGRAVQSAINYARRMTIGERCPHRVLLYIREETVGERVDTLYGVRIYADGQGYVGEAYTLLSGLRFDTQHQGLPVLDRLPAADSTFFETRANPGRFEFRTDGTARFEPPYVDTRSAPTGYPDIYDVNVDISEVPENFPADIIIIQPGLTRRCFIDVVPNTGRVDMRVLDIGPGSIGGGS